MLRLENWCTNPNEVNAPNFFALMSVAHTTFLITIAFRNKDFLFSNLTSSIFFHIALPNLFNDKPAQFTHRIIHQPPLCPHKQPSQPNFRKISFFPQIKQRTSQHPFSLTWMDAWPTSHGGTSASANRTMLFNSTNGDTAH